MKHLLTLAIIVCSPLLLAQGTEPINSELDMLPRLEKEVAYLESICAKIDNLKGDALWAYIAPLPFPDEDFHSLYQKYTKAKAEKARLISTGKGASDTAVVAVSIEIKKLQSKLDKAALEFRATLQAQFDLGNATIASAKAQRAKDKNL